MKDEKVIGSKTFISGKVGGAEYFDYMTMYTFRSCFIVGKNKNILFLNRMSCFFAVFDKLQDSKC